MKTNLPAKYVFVIFAAVLLASCSTQPHVPTEPSKLPVWPPLPDQPRIAYVRSLHLPRDIGQSPSVFTRIGHWITGENGESQALQKPFGIQIITPRELLTKLARPF